MPALARPTTPRRADRLNTRKPPLSARECRYLDTHPPTPRRETRELRNLIAWSNQRAARALLQELEKVGGECSYVGWLTGLPVSTSTARSTWTLDCACSTISVEMPASRAVAFRSGKSAAVWSRTLPRLSQTAHWWGSYRSTQRQDVLPR